MMMEVFLIILLCDDIRRVIFGKLTVQELVRVEVVSTQWQRDVREALRHITQIVFWDPRPGNTMPPTTFCRFPGHQYVHGEEIRNSLTTLQIEAFIGKLPNLTTLYIDSNYIVIVECVVTNVFKNCRKLRHLDVPANNMNFEVILNELDLSQLTCLSNIAAVSPQKFKNLKFLSNALYELDDVIVLLNRGLIGLATDNYFELSELKRAIFEHGHNLQVLNVIETADYDTFDEDDIRQISEHCKQLKEIRVYGPPNVLKGLEGAQNLDTLNFAERTLTKDYIQVLTFGQRLRKLTLRLIVCADGSVIAELNEKCPNLLELECFETKLEWGAEIEPNLGSNFKLVTFEGGFRANENQIRTFLNAYPNLRRFASPSFIDSSTPTLEVREWVKNLQSDFSNIRFEMPRVLGTFLTQSGEPSHL